LGDVPFAFNAKQGENSENMFADNLEDGEISFAIEK